MRKGVINKRKQKRRIATTARLDWHPRLKIVQLVCTAVYRPPPPRPPRLSPPAADPPHKGRAIACGFFRFLSCSEEHGWIRKLRARVVSDSNTALDAQKLAICDCPAHK